MGNCCATPSTTDENRKGKNKPNPFSLEYGGSNPSANGEYKTSVLDNPTGNEIEKTYVLGKEMGRGEFGITYMCTDKTTGEVFACKSISKKKLRTRLDIEDVKREVEIMKHLPPHPNIVSLKDTYEDDNAVHLVMELCEGGDLLDRIVDRGHYYERAAASVTMTIVEVIQMCHKHGVMHRDLKPENFLFANKNETAALKAISFGLSVFFKPGERFNEIAGSPYYMAPEVLKRNYGPEVDVWSAGVILYILLCGVPPFWAETEQGVAQAIIRSNVDFKRDPWPKVSDSAKDLVKKMLNPDPKLRLTAQEVLDHPWIQNAKKAPNVSLGETVKARLKQFSVMNKLKKRALRVIAEQLSSEEVAGIKEVFDLMDTNKQGKINIVELKAGFQKLGHQIPDADLQIIMEAGDVDKDGFLNYGEFVAISVHLRKMGNDYHLKDAFAFFDKNQSGYIEIEELREALAGEDEANNEEVISAIIHDVDTDKDGKISFKEFTAMMKADHPWIQNAKKAPNVSLGETVKARLKQFSVMNKLKKRALRVIAKQLSAEEVAGIKEGFDFMDTNKQGKINIVELKAGLQKLGHHIHDADLQILMEAGDVDKDGFLSYGEFVAISVHLRKMGNDDHLKDAFAFFDKNQSGYIEIEELREALAGEDEADNEEVISAIIHDVDTDKDGKISFEEFTAMINY